MLGKTQHAQVTSKVANAQLTYLFGWHVQMNRFNSVLSNKMDVSVIHFVLCLVCLYGFLPGLTEGVINGCSMEIVVDPSLTERITANIKAENIR